MAVVFARTRHVYGSYTDFWSLVELAGFRTCYVDEIDIDANLTYVTTPMTGELKSRNLPKDRRAKIIWWNLERPDGEFAQRFSAVIDEVLSHVDEIWVSDRYYQSMDQRQKFVILGSHPGLLVEPWTPGNRWDVAHLSYMNGRRNHVYGRLQERGLTLAPNAWGNERTNVLFNSSVLLNVHQTDALIGEPLRFAVAAAHAVPLLSETILDAYPLAPGVDFLPAHYEDLVDLCGQAARGRIEILTQLGANLYERLCVEHPFGREVRKALDP